MPGPSNPRSFVKQEPTDFSFDPNRFVPQMDASQHNHNFGSWRGDSGSIDPSELNMIGSSSQGGYGSQQNLSSSYIAGNSAIADDEIEELIRMNDGTRQQGVQESYSSGIQMQHQYNEVSTHSYNVPQNSYAGMNHQNSYLNQVYSSTPDGAPIQSPFIHSFNYNQWQTAPQHRPSFDFNNISPAQMPANSLLARRGFSHSGERGSSSRSPMTPKTPAPGAMANVQHGIPDTKTLSGMSLHPSRTNSTHRRNPSSPWDGTPGSALSYMESPISSPSKLQNPQIAEVLEASSVSSIPVTKIELGPTRPGTTIDAKKQRRRESHNAVERRRRNNINDRIAELSRLVPGHRLEDDLVKKPTTLGNGLLSSADNGLSPPQFLGAGGRRPSGNLSQGIPESSLDKGPAKGDVLNGAVSWTRDLMWMVHRKLEHERILLETIDRLGGQSPLEITDDEQRMRTELLDALRRNDIASSEYTRSQASGLWIPSTDGPDIKSSSTPRHGTENGLSEDHRFWGFDAPQGNTTKFKEEDEYDDMEL